MPDLTYTIPRAARPELFRYPGGKAKAAARRFVLDRRPRTVAEYREPFAGGGGIFFALDPTVPRWVNDRDPDLVAVYLALRDRPTEFATACRETSPAVPDEPTTAPGPHGGKPVNARLKKVFDKLTTDPTADPALRYYFLNRCGFGGRVNYALPSRLRFTNAEGWNVVAGDALERAAALLKDVTVTCDDFAPLLAEPGTDVWVYCDPPYLVNDALPPSCRLYRHAFTEADHRRFAAAAGASPHRVAVSYGDDPAGFARSLFPGWRVAQMDLNYGGTTGGKAAGRELLFLNYDPERVAVPVRVGGRPPVARPALTRAERRSEVKRLKGAGLSLRKIAARVGVSLQTVQNDLKE